MPGIKDFSRIIEKELSQTALVKDPEGLYLPIKYILDIGGKRIRPSLLLFACYIFSGKWENAIPAAKGIELFHNFTLLHDDIMDNSGMRRNKETVHVKWDVNTAILSGDAMSIMANMYVSKSPESTMLSVLECFNKTALEVCEGQQYDMEFESRTDVSVEEYIRMIELKTSVLLAASLKIGAIIGDASEEEIESIYEYGRQIGIGFQLQDDFLDTFGDEEIFGKKIGGDITENKKTFLLIKSLELADDKTRQYLISLLNDNKLNQKDKVRKVSEIYVRTGAKEECQKLIQTCHNKAMQHLKLLNIREEHKNELRAFSSSLTERKY